MNKTIEALKDDISNSIKLKEKILLNLIEKTKKEMILNQVELNFNFEDENIELIYYVIDSDYPNVKIDFNQLRSIVKS